MNSNNSSTLQTPKKTRKGLFLFLEFILGVSHKKMKTLRVKDRSKQGWALGCLEIDLLLGLSYVRKKL